MIFSKPQRVSNSNFISKFALTNNLYLGSLAIFFVDRHYSTNFDASWRVFNTEMDADFNSYRDYVQVNLSGKWVSEEAKNALKASLEAARAASVDKILLDMTQIELPDSDLVRIDSAESLVEILGTSIKVAVVKRKDDPSNLGYQFAQSRGANIHVSTNPNKALDWLLSE